MKKIKKDYNYHDYAPPDKEDIEDDRSYHPGDVSTRNSGDDYPSDDEGNEPQFRHALNGYEKIIGYHDTIEEEDPIDNTGVGIKN